MTISRLSFAGSIREATRDPGDHVTFLDQRSPDEPKPIVVEVKPGMEPLEFTLKSR